MTYAGAITNTSGGSLGLVKLGGNATLIAANTYTGGTTVNGGTLNLGYNSGGVGTIVGTLNINPAPPSSGTSRMRWVTAAGLR